MKSVVMNLKGKWFGMVVPGEGADVIVEGNSSAYVPPKTEGFKSIKKAARALCV